MYTLYNVYQYNSHNIQFDQRYLYIYTDDCIEIETNLLDIKTKKKEVINVIFFNSSNKRMF